MSVVEVIIAETEMGEAFTVGSAVYVPLLPRYEESVALEHWLTAGKQAGIHMELLNESKTSPSMAIANSLNRPVLILRGDILSVCSRSVIMRCPIVVEPGTNCIVPPHCFTITHKRIDPVEPTMDLASNDLRGMISFDQGRGFCLDLFCSVSLYQSARLAGSLHTGKAVSTAERSTVVAVDFVTYTARSCLSAIPYRTFNRIFTPGAGTAYSFEIGATNGYAVVHDGKCVAICAAPEPTPIAPAGTRGS